MYDLDFIHLQEGFEIHGYVPPDPNTQKTDQNSGVTIGHGFDLGQINVDELRELISASGLPPELQERLTPYVGLKGDEAQSFVSRYPVTISKSEAAALSKQKYKLISDTLVHHFNRDAARAGSSLRFDELPKPVRTTLMSVAVQFGSLPSETPKFWNYAITGDFKGMIGELRDFGPNDKKRRNREADYLERELSGSGS